MHHSKFLNDPSQEKAIFFAVALERSEKCIVIN